MSTSAMSAVDDLRVALDKKKRAQEAKDAERVQREAEACLERFVMVFGKPLMDELQAKSGYTGRRGLVWLTYRGERKAWGDLAGYADPPCATPESLAGWLAHVDGAEARFEADREDLRKRVIGMAEGYYAIDMDVLAKIDQYRLREFEDVRAALEAHEARRLAAVEADKHKRREEVKAELQELLAKIGEAKAATEKKVVYAISEWEDRHAYVGFGPAKTMRNRLIAALEEAERRIDHALEAREELRMDAEREAFCPFVFYRAHYGIVAMADGESFVETEYLDALHKPVGGVWIPIGKNPVELAHLVKVEHIAVGSAEDLPRWAPTRTTEWGKIRVAPEGAEV